MKHAITVLLLAAAWFVYSLGYGPLFFGAPAVGVVLVAVGLALEALQAFRKRPRVDVDSDRRRFSKR